MQRANILSSYPLTPTQKISAEYRERSSPVTMTGSAHHTMAAANQIGSTIEEDYSKTGHNKPAEVAVHRYLTKNTLGEKKLDPPEQEEDMAMKTEHAVDDDPLPADAAKGLFSGRAMFYLFLWYFFSLLTLFLNRIILTSLGGDPVVLSTFQMIGTTSLGLAQMHFPCGMFKKVRREGARPQNFYRNMIIVGVCRFCTVFLGLVALEFVEVSFTETVKSSAPIFTVLIARVLSGDVTGLYTQLSLIPIMSGLALCSAYELSFNVSGFVAALGTNLTECLQNVFSKMLICGKNKYTPGEMQYYTSVASIVIQVPFCLFLIDFPKVYAKFTGQVLLAYVANGIFFHYQTIAAYVLMGYISPVTHSVANTVKRALLIWLSVLFFGNTVTFLSGFGTMIVFIGVLMYNRAKEYDSTQLKMTEMYNDAKVNTV